MPFDTNLSNFAPLVNTMQLICLHKLYHPCRWPHHKGKVYQRTPSPISQCESESDQLSVWWGYQNCWQPFCPHHHIEPRSIIIDASIVGQVLIWRTTRVETGKILSYVSLCPKLVLYCSFYLWIVSHYFIKKREDKNNFLWQSFYWNSRTFQINFHLQKN